MAPEFFKTNYQLPDDTEIVVTSTSDGIMLRTTPGFGISGIYHPDLQTLEGYIYLQHTDPKDGTVLKIGLPFPENHRQEVTNILRGLDKLARLAAGEGSPTPKGILKKHGDITLALRMLEQSLPQGPNKNPVIECLYKALQVSADDPQFDVY